MHNSGALVSQPVRKIPGTALFAITTYRSNDGSIRDYRIVDADGNTLGRCSWHTSKIGRSAGYHRGESYRTGEPSWRNLTEVALAFAAEARA